MRIYNTLSRKLEDFIPISDRQVGMYVCGPTVYDYAHIGHMRKFVGDDVLRRAMEYLGYSVKMVMNITDVGHLVSDADEGEDKMEKGARKFGKSVWDIAAQFTQQFLDSTDALNVRRPDILCKATDHIGEQIQLIKVLEGKSFTYKTSDGIYFDTSKLADYGQLARLDKEGLQEGARVEKNLEKKNPTDFVLWKFSPTDKKRQMEWESPWGVGFPGWHIECSAMSMKYLGEQFDIHTGGIDHIAVHHPNEIAQTEAATGKSPFVKYWVHHNFLQVDSQKMSKSLENICTVQNVIDKGFDPLALRYLFLTAHYRSEMNFTWEALNAAQAALRRLKHTIIQLANDKDRQVLSEEKLEKVDGYREKFKQAISDDLNTAQALAVVWEVAKSNLSSGDKYELLLEFDKVLGLGIDKLNPPAGGDNEELKITEEVQRLLDKREELRKERKFAEADEVRKRIEELGYLIEDSDKGPKISKISKAQVIKTLNPKS